MGYTSNDPLAGIPIYASAVNFPITAQDGEQAVAADTNTIYIYDTTTPGWAAVANPGAAIAIDALLGDVTATGPGVVAATIAPAAVTNAKLAAMSDNTIKGNKSGGPASPTDLALSDVVETGSSVLTITNGTDVIVGASNLTIEVAAESSAVDNTLVLRDNLGNFETASMAFDLSPSPAPAGAEGKLKWNSDDGTLDLGMGGGNVTQQIGQEQYIRIVNKSGSTILDGQVVRIVGAQGNRTEGELARADSVANSKNTIGIATEDIANNDEGFITTFGLVRGLNTSAYAEGDILYLSPTTFGALTNVAPGNTYSRIQIGIVIVDNISNGSIMVQVHPEPSLGELSNVVLTAPADGQVLEYDSGTSSWINATLVTLPPQGSADEKVLASNGTSAGWFYAGLGDGALGAGNVVLGRAAPASISTNSIVIGTDATVANGDAVAIGKLANSSGGESVAIGYNARALDQGGGGNHNIAIGKDSHCPQAAGIAIGFTAQAYQSAVAIGRDANVSALGGGVAVGRGSVVSSSGYGTSGIAIGYLAISGSGQKNIVIGHSSGTGGLTGANNTVVGTGSFNAAGLTSAANNTIIGQGSGTALTTGGSNILLGYTAGSRQSTNSQLLIIDNQQRADAATEATNSIIYGSMALTPDLQTLALNAKVQLSQGEKHASLHAQVGTANVITALATNYYIGVVTASAAKTVNLPAAAGAGQGFILVVKDESGNAATNNIIIDANASELIDGALTQTIAANYGALELICSGTAWFIK